jgi:ATP-binding cassette subfamily F protein 1
MKIILTLTYRRGKSTLLRLLAKRQLPVPENLDVLLVEQEVEGGEP